ncbi:MAG: hypothetical protein PHS44_03605 [Candidatus Dojkabacteria bacterium]|nr:hypothetical protein [Candidatus Dojkabacteria bacterium]
MELALVQNSYYPGVETVRDLCLQSHFPGVDNLDKEVLEGNVIWGEHMVAFVLFPVVIGDEISIRVKRCDALALCFFHFFTGQDYPLREEFSSAFEEEYPCGGTRNKISFTRSWLGIFFQDSEWVWYMPAIGTSILLQEGVIKRGLKSKSLCHMVQRALGMLSPEELDVLWWAFMQKRGDELSEELIKEMQLNGWAVPPGLIT